MEDEDATTTLRRSITVAHQADPPCDQSQHPYVQQSPLQRQQC